MEKYEPNFLGKVIPADDPSKLNDFVVNKFDSFTTIYNACKNQSENIDDIKAVDTNSTNSTELSVKITASESTLEDIKKQSEGNDNINVSNNVITAKSSN